jgi:hypothetical protein
MRFINWVLDCFSFDIFPVDERDDCDIMAIYFYMFWGRLSFAGIIESAQKEGNTQFVDMNIVWCGKSYRQLYHWSK